jgi:hypothetical protein
MNEKQIQYAVARWLGWNAHLIVPNVSWGFDFGGQAFRSDARECDLLSVTKQGYATEVEIKTSVADLRQDAKKPHHHESPKIKHLIFAMPEAMRGHESDVPARAGIIYVKADGRCVIERKPTPNKGANPLSHEDQIHLGHLAAMRMWAMKGKQEGK